MDENNAKLDWMYKGASGLVDREEYLLGRTVDKTLEQLNNEEKEKKLGIVPPKNHVEHECIPPSIRDFNKIVAAEQVDLSAKLQEDPLVAIKKREEEARRQFLQNPVQLKKLQEALKAQEMKKKKKKRKTSASDSDLDQKIIDKLKRVSALSSLKKSSKRQKNKSKESILDTILMHKFNELKDRLTEEDMKDIMEGRLSDDSDECVEKIRTHSSSSESENERKCREQKRFQHRNDSFSATKKTNHRKDSYDNRKLKNRSQRRRLEKYSESDTEEKTRKSFSRRGGYFETEGNNGKRKKKNDSSESDTDSDKKNLSTRDRRRRSRSSESESRKVYKTKVFVNEKNKSQSKANTHVKKSRKYGKNDEFKNNNPRESKKSRTRSESESTTSSNESTEDKQKYKRHRKESNNNRNDKGRGSAGDRMTGRRRKASENSDDDSSSGHIESHGEKQYKKTKHRVERSSSRDRSPESSSNIEEGSQRKSKYKIDSRYDNRERNKKSLNRSPSLREINACGDKKSDNDLDKLILEKLRSLRNTEKADNLLPPDKHSESESEQRIFSHIDSDNDEPVYKKKNFGLVRADGTKIPLKRTGLEKQEINLPIKKNESIKKPERKIVKKLSEEEKEQLRKQMMKDAEVREHERSQNLRKYREENKEVKVEFDKNFVHKELVKSTQTTSVEERIKSKLNNIQRSSMHMNSNFSRRY